MLTSPTSSNPHLDAQVHRAVEHTASATAKAAATAAATAAAVAAAIAAATAAAVAVVKRQVEKRVDCFFLQPRRTLDCIHVVVEISATVATDDGRVHNTPHFQLIMTLVAVADELRVDCDAAVENGVFFKTLYRSFVTRDKNDTK
jgi:hypothetical protein